MAPLLRVLTALVPAVIACASNTPAPEAATAGTPDPAAAPTTAPPPAAPVAATPAEPPVTPIASVTPTPPPAAESGTPGPCAFPEGSEINEAEVVLRVQVREDGSVGWVEVVRESAPRFGETARQCTLSRGKFDPPVDAAGKPINKLLTVRLRFKR
ncbi:MAG TPA: energy transducer TonB [Polyangiaceae bacterium]|nr:energy transducer TonB [Polyangiaceae bacterium]